MRNTNQSRSRHNTKSMLRELTCCVPVRIYRPAIVNFALQPDRIDFAMRRSHNWSFFALLIQILQLAHMEINSRWLRNMAALLTCALRNLARTSIITSMGFVPCENGFPVRKLRELRLLWSWYLWKCLKKGLRTNWVPVFWLQRVHVHSSSTFLEKQPFILHTLPMIFFAY